MPGMPFPELPGSADLPAIEREILRRWADGKIFERSLEQTAGGRRWIFYEGPPTANGMPGVHHIEARVFKDAFPRFKTMQGFHVPRRAGWDCHGLPVEVAVEKELGLTAKQDIEAYGIAAFNARCRESVLRHVDAFAELTRRMGYWIDLSTAYRTMDPAYIESVWWSLKKIYGQGLLVRDYRISPYCPRCGTPLSDHEMGQPDVYRTVTDPSVIVRFPLRDLPPGGRPELRGADLLVWTTTPWTLVSNTAVAVHPDELYAVARRSGHGDRVVVADNLVARVLGEGWHVTTRLRGSELAGATYQPPFDLVEVPGAHRVITAGFVTTQDGTGLVHLAPAFGADDLAAGREHGLPVVNPVRPDGRFTEDLPLIGGLFFKAADRRLISDLADRDLLFRSAPHEHSYPHCWRCGTPLLYYAMPSWFIRTTAIRDRLLAQNAQTSWQPPSIQDGRYGEWLRNNVDWALSRTRYWGTPLPLWQCPSGHVTCVGSLAELSELAGTDLTGLDPHRPFVDDVVISCPDCAGQARRVPEVIDVWYDSGSMPFAQFGAPLRNEAEFERSYPAQFICEAIDQTRGWFYSLMAVGTLVLGRSAYENVVCLGLIADEHGRKMSKHLGNVLEPLPLLEAHGADAVRWFFFAAGLAVGDPQDRPRGAGGDRPQDPADLLEHGVVPGPLRQRGRGSRRGLDPGAAGRRTAACGSPGAGPVAAQRAERGGGRCDRRAGEVRLSGGRTPSRGLHRRPVQLVCAQVAAAVLGRSRHPRRSGRVRDPAHRAGDSDPADGAGHAVPDGLPVGSAAGRGGGRTGVGAPGSLASRRPEPDRRGPGQPGGAGPQAGRARPRGPGQRGPAGPPAAGPRAHRCRRVCRPVPRAAGPGGRRAQRPRAGAAGCRRQRPGQLHGPAQFPGAGPAVRQGHPARRGRDPRGRPGRAGHCARAGRAAEVAVAGVTGAGPGGLVRLSPEDVTITQTPRAGWAVSASDGETVALATAVTPELRREGLARQFIRLVQEARKGDGLAVTDRITLRWATADAELARALADHASLVSGEVLATSNGPVASSPAEAPGGPADAAGDLGGAAGDLGDEHADADLGLTFWIQRA